MFVLSSKLSRETSFVKMHLKLPGKLQFDGQEFEAVLMFLKMELVRIKKNNNLIQKDFK